MRQATYIKNFNEYSQAYNVFGLGEVAEPNIELKNKTLKLKKND